jgi:hypothetical protein
MIETGVYFFFAFLFFFLGNMGKGVLHCQAVAFAFACIGIWSLLHCAPEKR